MIRHLSNTIFFSSTFFSYYKCTSCLSNLKQFRIIRTVWWMTFFEDHAADRPKDKQASIASVDHKPSVEVHFLEWFLLHSWIFGLWTFSMSLLVIHFVHSIQVFLPEKALLFIILATQNKISKTLSTLIPVNRPRVPPMKKRLYSSIENCQLNMNRT